MVCVMVTGLSVKGHRHTRGNRGRGIPMRQLPGTVVILQAFNLPDQAKACCEQIMCLVWQLGVPCSLFADGELKQL